MVKSIVIVCTIISIVFVLWFFFFIALKNTGSDEVITPTIQITAAIMAGVIFFAVGMLRSDDDYKSETLVHAVYHDEGEFMDFSDDLILVNSKFGWGFDHLQYISKLISTEEKKPEPYRVNTIATLQSAFIVWLSSRNSSHWDAKVTWHKGNGSSSFKLDKNENSEEKPQKISTKETLTKIDKVFGQFDKIKISEKIPPMTISEEFYLPSGSQIEVNKNVISIKNKDFVLDVKFEYRGGNNHGIGYTRLGQRIESRFDDKSKWNSSEINVEFKATYFRWKKYSNKTIAIKNWVENTTLAFDEDFGFENIKSDLEDSFSTMKSNWVMVTPSTGYKKK